VNGSFEVRTADDLLDAEFTAKWRDRAALEPLPREVLGVILDVFIASEGPVGIETVVSRLADRDPAEVRGAVALLDEKDLLLARGGQVLLAYPFSGMPNAFRVVFPDGRERYACCAIDAHPDSPGAAAILGEAFALGATIFGTLLRDLLAEGILSHSVTQGREAQEGR
jgi:hypothetical protein